MLPSPAPRDCCRNHWRDESRAESADTCRTGTNSPPSRHQSDRRVGLGVFASSAAADMICPRLAVSALRHLLGDPRPLHRMCVVRRQSLDRRDLLRPDRRHRSLARAHGLAIKMHRARSAQSHPAAILRAGQIEFVAQNPQQRRVGSNLNIVRTVVDQQMNRSHGRTPERRLVALDEATPKRFAGANQIRAWQPDQ